MTRGRVGAVALACLALVIGCHAAPDAPVRDEPLVPEVFQLDDPLTDVFADVVEARTFSVSTYEGSGQMVHPDAYVAPHLWRGRRYWYAATPYPYGDAGFENPSAYFGDASDDWRVLPGVTNPLATPDKGASYLSDPDLSYDPSHDELRLYYRQTRDDADQIFLKTSRNGADWSAATLVVQDARYNVISPAVVREQDGSWRMWAVSARPMGCKATIAGVSLTQRRSNDGRTWSGSQPVTLAIPGQVPWHWDVQYVKSKSEYWALVAAFPQGSNCSYSAVYFARSADGTTWRASPIPLLAPGEMASLNDLVYRSTFRYFSSEDVVTVWFSGARQEGKSLVYSLATARYPLAELMRRVETPHSLTGDRSLRTVSPIDTLRMTPARAAFVERFP